MCNMKSLKIGMLVVLLLASVFATAGVFAQGDSDALDDSVVLSEDEARVPSGLGRALERLDLLLTFDKSAKAEKGLEHARRRLLEVRTLVEQKKFDQAERARARYGESLERVNLRLEEVRDDENPEAELERKLRIERRLAEHEDLVERLEAEFELRVNGNLTDEQREAIDNLMEAFRNETGKVRLKFESEKDKVRVKLKAKLERSDEEIEDLLEEKEREFNVTAGYMGASERAIARASELISRAEERLNEAKTSNATRINLERAEKLLSESKSLLEEAKNASANGEYQKSIRLANKAASGILRFVHANLGDRLEKALERTEEARERFELRFEEGGRRVEIRIEERIKDGEVEVRERVRVRDSEKDSDSDDLDEDADEKDDEDEEDSEDDDSEDEMNETSTDSRSGRNSGSN